MVPLLFGGFPSRFSLSACLRRSRGDDGCLYPGLPAAGGPGQTVPHLCVIYFLFSRRSGRFRRGSGFRRRRRHSRSGRFRQGGGMLYPAFPGRRPGLLLFPGRSGWRFRNRLLDPPLLQHPIPSQLPSDFDPFFRRFRPGFCRSLFFFVHNNLPRRFLPSGKGYASAAAVIPPASG